MAWVRLGRREYSNDFQRRVDPRGREYYWMAGRAQDVADEPDTDVGAVASGSIAVTPLQLDATAYQLIPAHNLLEVPTNFDRPLA
jgi:5'-nucleotidase